eukprot:780054-Pyramimonas_sp.AAC.1
MSYRDRIITSSPMVDGALYPHPGVAVAEVVLVGPVSSTPPVLRQCFIVCPVDDGTCEFCNTLSSAHISA